MYLCVFIQLLSVVLAHVLAPVFAPAFLDLLHCAYRPKRNVCMDDCCELFWHMSSRVCLLACLLARLSVMAFAGI